MLNDLLERKLAEAAKWFCDNPNCSDIEDAMRELIAEAISIENEACAKVCEARVSAKQLIKEGVLSGYEAGMIVDANAFCASAIRKRANNQVQRAAESGSDAT